MVAGGASVSDQVNVGNVINRSTISPIQILVFVLGITIALVDGYDTQSVAYALTSMATEWNAKPPAFPPPLIPGLFGLRVGSSRMAPLGDKPGHKPMAITATVVFGIC